MKNRMIQNKQLYDIIWYVLDEMLAADGEIRLEPYSVYRSNRRKIMKRNMFLKVCEKFNIPYSVNNLRITDEDMDV